MSSTIFSSVPQNYLLTSGVNSALTWTNVVSVSSMSASTLNASALTVSTLATSTSVNASTITTRTLNYSSIVGSSLSSNVITLSLTNTSTQNTQLYETVNSSITSSFSAIQASFISSGTNYNTLALNPNGGNVGIGTTAPTVPFVVSGSSTGYVSGIMNVINNNTTPQACANILAPNISTTNGMLMNMGKSLSYYNAIGLAYYHQGDGSGSNYLSLAGYGNPNGLNVLTNGNVGVGTTTPATALQVSGTTSVNALQMNAGGSAFQIARGTNAGVGTSTGTVSFPFTFANIPVVTANVLGLNGSVVYSMSIYNVTTTGFTYLKTYLPTGGSVTAETVEGFQWIAVG